MRINLRELRNALRYPQKVIRPGCVILACEKAAGHDHATITVEDTISASETAFTTEPGAKTDEIVRWRASVDRTKLENIAERWDESDAELTAESDVLRIVKKTQRARLEAALALEPAAPPHCVDLRYNDAAPAASPDTKTVGEVLTRLEGCAPPGRAACIQSARNRPGELWIEMFDDLMLVAGQAPGTPPAEAIALTTGASKRIAKMLHDPNRYTARERLAIRRGIPRQGPETVEMIVDRPRPGGDESAAGRFTSGRIQWVSRTAAAPELMRRAYTRLETGELAANLIGARALRKFVALANAVEHDEVVFRPQSDPARYTARSVSMAGTDRAAAELQVDGDVAHRAFAVKTIHLSAIVKAMPEWQPKVSLNALLDETGEIEGLMVWAGENTSTADAYGVVRTLPRRD